ncbi:melanopsin-like [Stylophora pistillata]|uniref:melanopsin-like n=1 Tax=Stylophora pistillata TaxID=50429 RepID=UPI000C03BE66|nr:melanopsin-like [Stylophora pistillata]
MESNNSWSTLFVAIKFVVCFFGIFLNGSVIFTICKNLRRSSPPCYLILSIAVSDFISCSVAIPISIAFHFQNQWPFGMDGCKAHAFMIFLLALVSITHLAVISVGKFLTITRSLSRDSYFNKSTVLWIVLGSWTYSLVFSVPPLLGWSRFGLEGTNESCSIIWESKVLSDKVYFGVIFFACYLLPITLIVFCYYKIHKVSSHIVDTTLRINRVAMTMSEALLKRHRKSAMYFLTIIAVFLLSWSPYAIVSFMTIFWGSVNPVATSACSVFAKTSFLLNPMLYAIVSRKFRRRMIQAIPISRPNRVVVPADAFHLTSEALAL